MRGETHKTIWDAVLKWALVYFLFFGMYQIFYKPIKLSNWEHYKIIEVKETDCELHIIYPNFIPVRLSLNSNTSAPFDFRLICPSDTNVDADGTVPKWQLILGTKPTPALQWLDENRTVVSNVQAIYPGDSWNTAEPLILHGVGLPILPITASSYPLEVDISLKGPNGVMINDRLNVVRENLATTIGRAISALLFENTLFGVLTFGLALLGWQKKEHEYQKKQGEELKAKIEDIFRNAENDPGTLGESMFEFYREHHAAISTIKPYWKKRIDQMHTIPDWQMSLAQKLITKDDEYIDTDTLSKSGLVPDNIVETIRDIREPGTQNVHVDNLKELLYFLGLRAIEDVIPQYKDKIEDLFPDGETSWWQRSAIGRYVATKYLGRSAEFLEPPLTIPRHLDYWFDPNGIVYPDLSLSTCPRPLKAEQDPGIRAYKLFYSGHPGWKKIYKEEQPNWLICQPGGGTSTFIRMGQYYHQPWTPGKAGFSLYVYWDGPPTNANWENKLRKSLYRSLQRALLEDPIWFYAAPEEIRKEIVWFLDANTPYQKTWHLPMEQKPDEQNHTIQKEINFLSLEIQRLRKHINPPDNPDALPRTEEVLQRCFETIMAYQKKTYHPSVDEFPWLWIELPATNKTVQLEKKVMFLQQNDAIWEYTVPKIFAPRWVSNLMNMENVYQIRWEQKDLKSLLEDIIRKLELPIYWGKDLDNENISTPRDLVRWLYDRCNKHSR